MNNEIICNVFTRFAKVNGYTTQIKDECMFVNNRNELVRILNINNNELVIEMTGYGKRTVPINCV